MILDEKISGTLDQRRGVFVLYENKKSKQIYEDAVETFGVLKEVRIIFGENQMARSLACYLIECKRFCEI